MQCTQCGTEVPVESVFCSRCGNRLVAASDAAPQDRLAPGRVRDVEAERELWRGTYSLRAAIPHAVVLGIVSVVVILGAATLLTLGFHGWAWLLGAVILAWLGLGIWLGITRLSVSYLLTTQRFVHEVGLLSRVMNRVEVIDIDDVTVEQGLIERMLGIGKIRLTSSDRTHPELVLKGIENVRPVAEQIDHARREERMRRGLHIEAV